MSEDILLREDHGHVAHLTMNSPKNLNALSDAMLAALMTEFERLENDRSARVVVIRGAGKAFCAGHDLKEMQAARQSPDGRGHALWRQWRQHRPVLLHPDGGAHPQHPPQVRLRDAHHG